MVLFGQGCSFWAKWLYKGKKVRIRGKVFVVGQKLLYLSINGCIR